MPIRYYIDLPCQPREDLGPEELLRLTLLRERALSMRARFEEKGLHDPAAMRFREQVVTTTGQETRERTVAELESEFAVLTELEKWCVGCPAALIPEPFGCAWSVSLPISSAAQCWLVERLPDEETRGLELFREAAEALGYGNANALANWRRAGFVEGQEPPTIERGEYRPNADMILTELFLVGDLMPTHILGVLLHLRALRASDGREGDELITMIDTMTSQGSAEDAPTIDFAIEPSEEDDLSTRELKQFLASCYLALELQVPLAVRL